MEADIIYCIIAEYSDGSGGAAIIGAFERKSDAEMSLKMINATDPGKVVTIHETMLYYSGPEGCHA